jgi:hypothetical protein
MPVPPPNLRGPPSPVFTALHSNREYPGRPSTGYQRPGGAMEAKADENDTNANPAR